MVCVEPRYKRVIAHVFGKRDSETFHKLQRLLLPFTIPIYCTDDFKVYSSYLPRENHIIGKRYTQRIERTNLTLRFSTKKISKKNHWFFEKRRDAR
ncbi:IS1 family transposase [Photobacterium damselae subsp. piscicida]|nr:IS1 family transposase [Photobacterium damselae subsp. piscicida]